MEDASEMTVHALRRALLISALRSDPQTEYENDDRTEPNEGMCTGEKSAIAPATVSVVSCAPMSSWCPEVRSGEEVTNPS